MKNEIEDSEHDPLDSEIDFSRARPNPYWLGVVDRRRVRLLDEELIALFPDNESVNSALRTIAEAARRAGAPRKRASAAERRVSRKR